MKDRTIFIKRVLMTVISILVCGLSVGLFKRATLGVDPFQTFMAGMDTLIPIEFGTLYVIVNVAMLLFSLIADRHYIGLGTFINLFFLGYVAQFSHETMLRIFPELGIFGRFVILLIGIVIMCFASAMYFTADMGVSTYDAVALIIAHTWKIGQFKYVRIITDLTCVIIGVGLFFLAGGKMADIGVCVGVGTIITAFFMGPLIDFFNRKVAEPFLYGKQR